MATLSEVWSSVEFNTCSCAVVWPRAAWLKNRDAELPGSSWTSSSQPRRQEHVALSGQLQHSTACGRTARTRIPGDLLSNLALHGLMPTTTLHPSIRLTAGAQDSGRVFRRASTHTTELGAREEPSGQVGRGVMRSSIHCPVCNIPLKKMKINSINCGVGPSSSFFNYQLWPWMNQVPGAMW